MPNMDSKPLVAAIVSGVCPSLRCASVKVCTKSFRPDPKQFFGDYNNISAYDGVVRPIWTRNDKGILSVWTAILDGYVE